MRGAIQFYLAFANYQAGGGEGAGSAVTFADQFPALLRLLETPVPDDCVDAVVAMGDVSVSVEDGKGGGEIARTWAKYIAYGAALPSPPV